MNYIVKRKWNLLILILLFLTSFFLFDNIFAKPINIPEIVNFSSSEDYSNCLNLTWDSKGSATIEVMNNTTKRLYKFGGATGYTFQGLTKDKTYEVMIRSCDRVDNLYDCTNWSPVKSATAKEIINNVGNVVLSNTNFVYDGKVKKPTAIVKNDKNVTLKEGTNYKITYPTSGMINVGTYKVVVKGLGNYKFTKELTYKILPAGVKSVSISPTSYTYNGKVKTPAVKVTNNKGATLVNNKDYTITYPGGRINVGKYKVSVKGKGNYSFTYNLAFSINKAKLSNASVSGISSKYKYAAKAVKPSPKISLGGRTLTSKDYSLSYSDNKMPGKASVTITGKGNYTGSLKKNYSIYNGDKSSIKMKSANGDGYSKKVTLSGRTYKLYLQGKGSYHNDKYGHNAYSLGGRIASNGCGPTSMTIALSGYGYDLDPGQVGRKLVKAAKSAKVKDPSSYTAMKTYLKSEGFNVTYHSERRSEKTYNQTYSEMKKALKDGHQIVMWVGVGGSNWSRYTGSGHHFISVLSIDSSNDKVFVGNPNNRNMGWNSLSSVVKARGVKFWFDMWKNP